MSTPTRYLRSRAGQRANPPARTKHEGWRLLNQRPVAALEQSSELIDRDLAHCEIGLFFLILKEGCCIEALQLGAVERIETSLARYLV